MSSRRRFALGIGVAVFGGLAGCASNRSDSVATPTSGPGTDEQTIEDGPTGERNLGAPEPPTNATGTGTDGAATETTTAELDLREANVTGVEVEPRNGSSRFSVTLYHDDDGEDGYADWWQVETVDGERLGRRELLHAHGTEPFTRSATIDVPEGVECVVVRGHDQTHGDGGQAMLVNAQTGATVAVRQGPDRGPVDASRCP